MSVVELIYPVSHSGTSLSSANRGQNHHSVTDSFSSKKKKPRRKETTDDTADELNYIEIEYVAPDLLDKNDPQYDEYRYIFDKFEGKNIKEENAHMEEETMTKKYQDQSTIQISSSDDLYHPIHSDEEEQDATEQLSKKKARKLNRMSVAELKQKVSKAEIVEWVDVTASDPLLLVQLKSLRNSVYVPGHWSQKRKYLQGKRGYEKLPFDLPAFIRDTGVMEMRAAIKEKEAEKGLKTKTRERLQPKSGKINLDYERLHDAFFKFQTKPRMTSFGQLYYEGKEFETKYKDKKPGILSDELKIALGIGHLAPSPWLINMQRYGPPPSYPHLKIPGLNAPIPDGAQWGYQPGGWGKAPVNEYNQPLYGDVFGVNKAEFAAEVMEPVEKKAWGELEIEGIEEEELERAEEIEEEEAPPMPPSEEGYEFDEHGYATPSGISSIASGLETPDFIELRKETKRSIEADLSEEYKPLYTIIPQTEKTTTMGVSGLMGSRYGYDLSKNIISKPLGKTEVMDVSLDVNEMDNLDARALKEKIESRQSRQQQMNLAGPSEDFSDLVAEHAIKQEQRKKKKADSSSGTGNKKTKEFKF